VGRAGIAQVVTPYNRLLETPAVLFISCCSSFSTMFTSQTGAYTSKGLQMCEGQSGSGIIDSNGKLIAVASSTHTGDGGKCTDSLLSPNININNVDAGSCERAAGGASLECLSKKLPA